MRRRAIAAGLVGVAAGVVGCSSNDDDNDGPDAPTEAPLPTTPRTAWVFSSGGPRGFVHVGVLKALAELGLQPDLIVGASAGAMVGVLWAAGRSAADIESLALNLQPWQMAGLGWGGLSALSGAPLARWAREQAGSTRLQELRLPAVCVAHMLNGRGAVGFSRGDLGLAVQASCAIEGRFAPVRVRGALYADADLHLPLPVRLARQLGATRVLAVDASAHEDRAPEGAQRYRVGDLHKRELTQPDAAAADVLLHPDFGYWVNLSREFRERCIAAGYRDALAAAARIRALHAV